MVLPFSFLQFSSCSAEAPQGNLSLEGEHGYNYGESKAQWDDLKYKNGNSYMYTVLEKSWTGTGSETKIVVEKGDYRKVLYCL